MGYIKVWLKTAQKWIERDDNKPYYRGIDRDDEGYCTCTDCAVQRKKEKKLEKKNYIPDELFEL